MKHYFLFLTLSFFSWCPVAFAAHDEAAASKDTHSAEVKGPATSQSEIMTLSDAGIEPRTIKIRQEDSIIFFLNSTKDSLATLEVDFGDKVTHCASSNMEIKNAGVVRSVKPFGPRDFASMCFHEAGKYPVKVYGLKANPKGVAGEIIVE